jgi:perosamine synthetase
MFLKLNKLLPAPNPKLNKPKNGKIIPVCEPVLAGNELRYLSECIRLNWISSAGQFIDKFEDAFRKISGTKYTVSCSSGTAALHLALAALGIKKGDEVIIPTFTMVATANAITYLGASPIFVDADAVTWNIDVERIEQKITRRTKAIITVHTYGLPADMKKILSIARRNNLYVVEDAAEAHGAEYNGRKVGSMGNVGCFSFYGNKIITTGEGGMVTTNNKKVAESARILRDHAFSKERHFWHKRLGYNYRMTNLQAAVGLAQVERFEDLLKAKIKNAKYYDCFLKGVRGINVPHKMQGIKNVYWMYSILIGDDFGITRDALRAYLARKGIETRTFFIPLHLQPIYFKHNSARFPIAEELCYRGLYIPSSAKLTKEDIEYIVSCVKSAQKIRG